MKHTSPLFRSFFADPARVAAWITRSLTPRHRGTMRLRIEGLEDRAVPTAALYFQARDLRNVESGGTGIELYSFDGTNATLADDIHTGPGTGAPNSSGPSGLVVFKGKLHFTATDTPFGGTTGNGSELWSYDGTTAVRVTDINSGIADANPNGMTVFNGKLYFAATQAGDTELWVYDGTTASRVADINTAGNSSPGNFTVLGNKLYFSATTAANGNELWVYDGASAPTMVGDLLPGTVSGFSGTMIAFNNRLYFSGADNMTGGGFSVPNVELFSYDPATNTFNQATELFGSGTSGFVGEKIVYNGRIYFSGLNPSDGFELFVHDPTNPAVNSSQVTNAPGPSNTGTGPSSMVVFNGNLYFGGLIDDSTFERELLFYNGTSTTTIQVGAGTNPSNPSNLFVFNNKLYFSANNGDGFGRELFELNTSNAFARKTDINPGTSSGSPQSLAIFDPDAASTNAADDAFGTDKDRTRILNVLANDTDPDNDPLTINQVNGTAISAGQTRTLASGALLTLNANKTFTYNPNGAFNGLAVGATATDTFTYRISDGTNQDTATVTMTISNLADVPVNTFADTIDANPAVTSLREAIIAANAAAGEVTIVLPAGTYILDRTGSKEDAASTGDLDITNLASRVIIQGAGSGTTTINASALNDRVFHLLAGSGAEISGVTIRDGVASDDGTNAPIAAGGGILNLGELGLNDVVLLNNRAAGVTGAPGANGIRNIGQNPPNNFIAAQPGESGGLARGGAIYNDGLLTITNSTLQGNVAQGGTGGRGGDAFSFSDGIGPLDSRSVGAAGGAGSHAEGGGIYSLGGFSIDLSSFINNQAIGGTGGAGGNGATLKGDPNDGGAGGQAGNGTGGGIFTLADFTINNTSLTGNSAVGGAGGRGGDQGLRLPGGAENSGAGGRGGNGGVGTAGGLSAQVLASTGSVLSSSTLSGNSATAGAAGAGGTSSNGPGALPFIPSSPGNPGSASVGALKLQGTTLTATQLTVSGNNGGGSVGGIQIANGATLNLRASTITLNTATSGGGVVNAGTANVRNTIVAGNTGTNADWSGAFTTANFNLLGSGTGATGISNGTNGNQVGVAAQLAALANNGGTTQTHMPLAGSPVLDKGSVAGLGLTTDQRGAPRITDAASIANATGGDGSDIGAVEATFLSINDVTKAEGTGGTNNYVFTVTRTDNVGPVSVNFATANNTTNASDFTATSGPLNFTAGGSTIASITVAAGTDRDVESDESFFVNLSGATGAIILDSQGVGTLQNDDIDLAIAATSAVKDEGQTGTTNYTFTVTRTGLTTGTTTVNYAVTGTGANPASATDFVGDVFPTGQVTFNATETQKVITVPVKGERFVETDENFRVTLSNQPATVDITTATADGTITNDDFNIAPTLTLTTATLTYTESDAPILLDASATVVDPEDNFDGGKLDAQITAGATAGDRLQLVANATVTFSGNNVLVNGTTVGTAAALSVTGSGTLSVTFNSSADDADVAEVLHAIRYDHIGDDLVTGSLTVTVTVSDDVPDSDSDTLTINTVAVNDAPTITAPASIGVTEDVASPLTGISFADVDSASFNVLATFSVGSGTLSATSGGGVTVGGSGTATVTLTGSIANINTFIGNSNVTFTTPLNSISDVTLNVLIDDQGNVGGGSLTANTNVTLTVTAVNDAPTIVAPPSIGVVEDVVSPLTGISFADVDAGSASVTATLTVPSGTLSAVSGGGVTVGGTSSAMTLAGSIADINAFLAANNVTFTTALNSVASVTLNVAINDNGNTGTPGPLSANTNVTLTVTAVNDAPSGTDNTVTTLEDTAYVFGVADFGFTDPNDSPANNFLAVKITTLPTLGTLTNNGNPVVAGAFVPIADINAGLLLFTPVGNANGSPYTSFTFQVQDDGGTSNSGVDLDQTPNTMTVNVISVNDEPSGTDNTVSTQVNTAYVFTAADFGFTDPNDSPSNNLLAVKITTLPATGALTDNGVPIAPGQFIPVADIVGGLLQYTPVAGTFGSPYTSFTFQVQDDGGVPNGGVDLDASPNTMLINVADTVPPVTTIATFPPALTNSTFASFQLNTSDNVNPNTFTLEIKLDNVALTGPFVSNGSFALNLSSLTDGTHTLSVRATDASGNVELTPVTYTWEVDTQGPTITIDAPTADYANNAATVSYTVKYQDAHPGPITLSQTDISLNSPLGASASIQVIPTVPGEYEVRLTNFTGNGPIRISIAANTAIDLAGNQAAAAGPSDIIIVDNIKPVVTIGPPNVLATLAGPVSWIVKVTDANLPPAYVLSAGDISVLPTPAAMASNLTITPLTSTATEKTFRVTLSGFTGGPGTVQIRVNANAVVDLAQNASDQSALSQVVKVTGRRVITAAHNLPPVRMLPGARFTYNVVGINSGTQAAPGAALIVKLPAYATFVPGASATGWVNIGNGFYRLDLGALAARTRVTAKFTVQFSTSIPRGTRVSFTSWITDTQAAGKLLSPRSSFITFGASRFLG